MPPDASPKGTFRKVFARSLNPMLIVDDSRRYVDANGAACALLGLAREEVLSRTISDFTPPQALDQLEDMWAVFLRDGSMTGTYELLMPDGSTLITDFSAVAAIEPGRHLTIFLLSAESDHELVDGPAARFEEAEHALSPREREVMGLLAVGETGEAVAVRLNISPETVRNHVRRAREKLGARTRVHAIALAIERGELDL
jgi:PAS domain S-box-containing protein